MDKIEQSKMSAKDMFEEVKPTYQESLNNNFDLDEYTKEKLTDFYNRTNEEVLKLALAEYQAKLLKQEEKYDIGNFNVEVLAITKTNFTKNEKLYLLSLYINKLVEYDFESLGLTSIDIIKKRTGYHKIKTNTIYDIKEANRPDACYNLKLGFSLIKTCIKENQSTKKSLQFNDRRIK